MIVLIFAPLQNPHPTPMGNSSLASDKGPKGNRADEGVRKCPDLNCIFFTHGEWNPPPP